MLREITPPQPGKTFKAHVHGGKDGPPCPHCQTLLQHDQMTGCPDGHPHCLVCHFGFVCPNCMAEFVDYPRDETKRTGIVVLPGDPPRPPLGITMTEKLGIGAFSPGAVDKVTKA